MTQVEIVEVRAHSSQKRRQSGEAQCPTATGIFLCWVTSLIHDFKRLMASWAHMRAAGLAMPSVGILSDDVSCTLYWRTFQGEYFLFEKLKWSIDSYSYCTLTHIRAVGEVLHGTGVEGGVGLAMCQTPANKKQIRHSRLGNARSVCFWGMAP